MKEVKTVRGRKIDMQALAKANEKMKAVSPGNIKLNARGDHIDNHGNVIQTVQAKSQAVRDTTSKPVKTIMSEVPGSGATSTQTNPKKRLKDNKNPIINQEEKVRADGTKYLEIEYADGSIVVKELDK